MLVLQFNTERRDRRKREYVMMESGDQQKLLDLFHPFIERNLAAFTVASKVEVGVAEGGKKGGGLAPAAAEIIPSHTYTRTHSVCAASGRLTHPRQ